MDQLNVGQEFFKFSVVPNSGYTSGGKAAQHARMVVKTKQKNSETDGLTIAAKQIPAVHSQIQLTTSQRRDENQPQREHTW